MSGFRSTAVVPIALAVFATACTFDDSRRLDGDSEALQRRLASRQLLAIDSASDVGVTALDRVGTPVPCVQPAVLEGEAVLSARSDTTRLVVESIDVGLSDLHVPQSETTYPADLTLTDVRLRLGTQVVVEPAWSFDGSYATGAGTADLLLDWSLLDQDGDVLPLATQLLRDVPFDVYAELDEQGRVVAAVRADVAGPLWDFSFIELTDLRVDLRAASEPPRDPLP